MSKVGILSMQRIKNYGSFLQAYGLKKMIESLGHEVEFVDYHIEKPIVIDDKELTGIKRKINKGIEVLSYNSKTINKLKYINYKRNFGKKYYKLLGIKEEYNYNPKLNTLVIGSDEVFNCIQSNSNVGYSLELFGKNNNANNLISYAASFGNTTYEKICKYNKETELSDLLSQFNSISVRDENSYNIVNKLTNKEANINLDPVLMYDFSNENIGKLKTNEKYMIIYAYNGRITDEESNYIKKIAKERNLKIYSIGGTQKCTDKFIDCSPFEVLEYFKNAEYVITDTFHGSIFSIITHKNFVTLVRKSVGNAYGNEEKLTYLLKKLNLNDRIIFDINDSSSLLEKNIDYEVTDRIIEQERNKTTNYLKENIK